MSPFANDPSQTIASLGETELIRQLAQWLGSANPPPPRGIGDDCSVYRPRSARSEQLATADPVIYGQHFDDALSPADAARKLFRRNLSDIAAMGGIPTVAILSLALDRSVSLSWIKPFYQTLAAEALANEVEIVGGDVSTADRFLGAFLTLIGETQPGHAALLRKKSLQGSPILVTGALGGTRRRKHHAFTPRLAEGQWLARRKDCLSCTDLSDGIGKDLSNLLPDRLACRIDCHAIPLSDDARETAASSGHSALYHAFNDGEDYELLFSLAPDTDLDAFRQAWNQAFDLPLARIGVAVDRSSANAPQIELLHAPEDLDPTGYEHLR